LQDRASVGTGYGGRSVNKVSVEGSLVKFTEVVNLPWREAGPPNHRDDKVDSDQ